MEEWCIEGTQAKRAEAIHRRSIVVDMCLTTNFARPTPYINGEDALDRSLKGGLTVALQTLVGAGNRTFREAIREVNTVYRLVESKPDKVLIVRNSGDIDRAKREGKMGYVMTFQGANPLEDDWINTLPVFQRLGVRIIAVTYNERNLLGSGSKEPQDSGLTAYGAQVVRGMNRMGIIIDLSHVGLQTSMDTIALSSDPVLFTHSNARSLNAHPRNLPDEIIKAAAAKGGVIGVNTWEEFCTQAPKEHATLSDFLDHMDYIVKLVGVDHVGIGSDVNENWSALPIKSDYETMYGYRAPSLAGYVYSQDIVNVTRGLVARGYNDENISKILGGNFLRVARQVWDKVL
jgi:membrane dipeptidase